MTTSLLLQNINQDFFKRSESEDGLLDLLDLVALESKWLGYAPATAEQISNKEKKLGTVLPKSYKDFLFASNGFRHISPFIYNLYTVEQIDWMKNIDSEFWWLDLIESNPSSMSDEEYLVYGELQHAPYFRPEYFRYSLKISDWGDACCVFLNPAIKHGDEWEVLCYATWFPGTERYRSFDEFLIHTHESNVDLLKEP